MTESNLVQSWRATLVVDTEPLIVARLIQRLACQGAVLTNLNFARIDPMTATIEFEFEVNAERAGLLIRQWRNLVSVQSVKLVDAGAQSPGPRGWARRLGTAPRRAKDWMKELREGES